MDVNTQTPEQSLWCVTGLMLLFGAIAVFGWIESLFMLVFFLHSQQSSYLLKYDILSLYSSLLLCCCAIVKYRLSLQMPFPSCAVLISVCSFPFFNGSSVCRVGKCGEPAAVDESAQKQRPYNRRLQTNTVYIPHDYWRQCDVLFFSFFSPLNMKTVRSKKQLSWRQKAWQEDKKWGEVVQSIPVTINPQLNCRISIKLPGLCV